LKSIEQNPETIQTINELVTALSEGERTTFCEILRSAKIPISDFEDHQMWSKECYTRNCLADTPQFELILLCWEPQQFSPIHDHGGEECWVKIIDGDFKETIYNKNNKGNLTRIRTNFAKPNDITYMTDSMGFHRLKNESNKRGLSLHLYAKPIRNCQVFDENSDALVNKELSYDSKF
jgi:cysteine dioxygenase